MRNWIWIFLVCVYWVGGWHVQYAISDSGFGVRRLVRQPRYFSRTVSDHSTSKLGVRKYSSNQYFYQYPGRDVIEPASSHQQFFRQYYGTQEGVTFLKRNYGPTGLRRAAVDFGIRQNLQDIRRANEHFLQIRRTATCHTPRPQVVNVKHYYPDPRRKYLPSCTILHRCTDNAGCCYDERMKCGPRAIQEVVLYFYTLQVGKQGTYVGLSNTAEKLLFMNHTECECRPIDSQPRAPGDLKQLTDSDKMKAISSGTKWDSVLDNPVRHPPTQKESKCRECPLPFYRREYPDGRCSCDCFDRHKSCLRIKRGRRPLSDIEIRCVRARKCHIPECRFGQYNFLTGKCPKRSKNHKRLKTRKENNKNQHHYHRWAFYERD
ncbi:uncharacterized protein LOC143236852 isoform X2 [Tachypleus tridentatus]|uniref:uncharacterized protein LOC143236852 isoform X2 n=1 Tax=Tachypleus tridentatus TaxID=6853 RepID=UPI003FD335C8